MKNYIIIKAELLQTLAIASIWWLRNHKEFEEYQTTEKFIQELRNAKWDDDAELIIMEMPF